MSLRERLLLRKVRQRDEKAFQEIVELYRDRVYNLTFRMMGNAEDAEDVAQEVFISVFKNIYSFRGDAKFSTWLYRVAANHCKNRIKYLARRHDRQKDQFDETIDRDQASGALMGPSSSPRPDARLETLELEQVMRAAIQSLDENQRLLVVLRDIEELSYEEICAITELPQGTVKSRLHRARVELRKKMTKYVKGR